MRHTDAQSVNLKHMTATSNDQDLLSIPVDTWPKGTVRKWLAQDPVLQGLVEALRVYTYHLIDRRLLQYIGSRARMSSAIEMTGVSSQSHLRCLDLPGRGWSAADGCVAKLPDHSRCRQQIAAHAAPEQKR